MSESGPLVAIVTPVYNGEEFLAECLASVQAQSYANLVHVIVDNASTDATPFIIEQFSRGRVPLLVHRNDCLIPKNDNYNVAVSLTPPDAAYFRLLCADDTITPDSIERMVDVARSDPEIGAVGCLHERHGRAEDALWPRDRRVFEGKEALRAFFLNKGMIIASHILVRADWLVRRTPFYDSSVAGDDTDACLAVLTQSKWGFVHAPLGVTRDHAGTATSTVSAPSNLQFLDWAMFMDRYLDVAFTPAQAAQIRRRYERHHLRRMLMWSIRGRSQVAQTHARGLAAIGRPPSLGKYLQACSEGVLKRLGLVEGWHGYPF